MPTAAKLVGAICLALSSMLVILIALSEYPDLERHSSGMLITAALVGLIVGWRNLGKLVVTDTGTGLVSGVRAGIATVLWVLGFFALSVMISGMLTHSYFQPMTALLQIPRHMIAFGIMGTKLTISGTIVVLAMGSGLMTKRAHNKWV